MPALLAPPVAMEEQRTKRPKSLKTPRESSFKLVTRNIFALKSKISKSNLRVEKPRSRSMEMPPCLTHAQADTNEDEMDSPSSRDSSTHFHTVRQITSRIPSDPPVIHLQPPFNEANDAPNTRSINLASPTSEQTLTGVTERSPPLVTPLNPPPPLTSSGSNASNLSKRTMAPRIQMPPSVFRIDANGAARLSPSIVTRAPTRPFMNLPTLPPSNVSAGKSTVPNVATRRMSRLGDMPGFTVDGVHDRDIESDHDDDDMGDSDDDEDIQGEDNAPIDDEEMETHEIAPRPSIDGSDEQGHHQSPTSRFLSSPGSQYRMPAFLRQPIQMSPADYFTHESGGRTPRAQTSPRSALRSPTMPMPTIAPIPGTPEERPTMYRLKSQSMVDISTSPKPAISVPSTIAERPIAGTSKTVPSVGIETPPKRTGTIRRQRSMPTFNPASDPPPYPHFDIFRKETIIPRDDEGKEHLPAYSNAIHLVAILPRKMEFVAPGVQAKDRKWRRTLCELDGTAFRVYKCPPGATGVGVIGEWWEKTVGVGDVTNYPVCATKNPAETREAGRAEKLTGEQSMVSTASLAIPVASTSRGSTSSSRPRSITRSSIESRTEQSSSSGNTGSSGTSSQDAGSAAAPAGRSRRLTSHLLHPTRHNIVASTSSHGRSRSEMSASAPSSQGRLSVEKHGRTRASTGTSNRSMLSVSIPSSSSSMASPSPISSARSPLPRPVAHREITPPSCPKPEKGDLLRLYTLQHAESGLGNDYIKRKNVIRVRMEGEQFLLQAPDVPAVVEWIEGLHAATDIALDIDERPMPRGPLFPRRRRRRPRRPDAAEPADHLSAR